VLALYAVTIFVAAGLLFLLQPLFARMVLPLLGGAPAVWNTALVFYQATLLAGYAYAHAGTARLGVRRQATLHLGVLVAGLLALPIAVPRGWPPPGDASPIPWLLAVLTVAVGLPFFAVSASSPILQVWLAGTGHPAARDPYVLYAASNLGSLLGLMSYPLLLEPSLRLGAQSRLWAAGYVVLLGLVAACAVGLWRSVPRGGGREPASGSAPIGGAADPPPRRLSARRRGRWGLLAFVPSSLMVSVTTYLSTDIAAIPLLWVIPLALYLLTFTLAFAPARIVPHRLAVEGLPLVMLPLVLVLAARANEPLAVVIGTHLLAFFVVAMVCHGELAADRPAAGRLTEFYLWTAGGGVLGGAFAGLIAPRLFSTVVEYPLALVLACLLQPRRPGAGRAWVSRALDVGLPLALLTVAIGLVRHAQASGGGPAAVAPVFGLLTLVCLAFARRPIRFGLGIAGLLLAGRLYVGPEGHVLETQRSFFGVHRVTLDASGGYHVLLHGTTLHGMQSLDPARRREPLTYYFPSGPIGQLFAALRGEARARRVAVVGLGAGSIACYGQPGQSWTFHEIDPVVERIARDPRAFTFLRDCPPAIRVVLGDARLSLAAASDGAYDLVILDAYSSDAPPLHLLTREALALYLRKLAPGGILAFNVSNRHLDLEPVLAALARAAGLSSLAQDDAAVSDAEWAAGKRPSQWVVMARQHADLGRLAADPRWRPPALRAGVAVWTDGYSSLWSVFRWR
jgi:SAM-dependent methyltransferase